jgi:hypothetical protein
MSKNFIDYNALDNVVNKKTYRLSEVKDQLEKVAFDVVRFKDSDKGADLWQIQSSDDGDYIVSLYEESEETVKTASQKIWEVVNSGSSLHFFYKGDPIAKLASSSLGFSTDDAKSVSKHLGKKLAENKKLVNLLLGQVEETAKQRILNKYPELA